MTGPFLRSHHNAIFSALRCFNGKFFETSKCYFGGGTAIVLELDEYRESVDIDFLCASIEGYRSLRQAVWGNGIDGLLMPGVELRAIRELRTDQYGIRTIIQINNMNIKFEIIRESRILLNGHMHKQFNIPVLDKVDMYTEKLLANADRWNDKSVLSRDILDLSMMISYWGAIPNDSWDSARNAYGSTVDSAYRNAIDLIRDLDWLEKCLDGMSIDHSIIEKILEPHGGPKARKTSIFD
ncbi:nucleotidyl transferase AbiEii/AbiGii toxin family protein [Myxococcota bacterium]|nr:nucleotidyl transferase AbiEii/AbiGii toxin family protein [Myxococcota bacterium]MBU1896721.1 nucleotidyl transferase AbiEii/AbiGii toxin family protein [Myxococcota bacterium]